MSTRRLSPILAVIVCLLLAGDAVAGPVAGTVRIQGKLTAGVTVQIAYGDAKVQKTVTDKKGAFRLNVPKTGSFDLVIFFKKKPYDTSVQVRSSTVKYDLDLARSRSGKLRLVKR